MENICSCGKKFNTFPYLVKQGYGKFCSQKCAGNHKRTSLEKQCQICGKTFLVEPNLIKIGKGKFCSKACDSKNHPPKDPLPRFLNNIAIPASECWEWTASILRTGYGSFSVNNKVTLAHRWAYQQYVGPIPKGLFVCHTCDNRKCVNPDHLFIGTHRDNIIDASKKGRLKGIKRNPHHLTELQVIEIIKLLQFSKAYTSIARIFSVSRQAIYLIDRNRSWKYLPRS